MRLGEKADIHEILCKMDCIFGNIDEKESIMSEFYNAKQKEDEDVAMWSCRLEDILSRAILTGKVKQSESDTMLHDMLWKGLKPELKDKSHYEKEKYTTFDDLRVALRKLEKEHQTDMPTLKSETKQTCKKTKQKKVNDNEDVDEDDEDVKGAIKQLNARLDKLESGATGKQYQPFQRDFRNYGYNQRRGNNFRGNYRGRGRGRGIYTGQSSYTTGQDNKPSMPREPIICRRCKLPGHIAKGCRATHDKDGKPLNWG